MPDPVHSLATLGVVGTVDIDAPIGRWRLEGRGRSFRLDLLSLPRRDRVRALGGLVRGLASSPQRHRLRRAQHWLGEAAVTLEITKGHRVLATADPAQESAGWSRRLGFEHLHIRPVNLLRALFT